MCWRGAVWLRVYPFTGGRACGAVLHDYIIKIAETVVSTPLKNTFIVF